MPPPKKKDSELLKAVKYMAKTNEIQQLIKEGANVNAVDDIGRTALLIAVNNEELKVVNLLINSGADVNKSTYMYLYLSPLYVASSNGTLPIVKRLIAAGADVNKVNHVDETPLYIASQRGRFQIVESLIAAGADVNKPKHNNETPLFTACNNEGIATTRYANTNYEKVVEMLINAGADKNIATNDGRLPMDVTKNKKIRILLKNKDEKSIKWLGWSRGDASMLDGIFSDDETARNFALCPVCMKYIIRNDACMYMSHNCAEQRGYYHDELYQIYKNQDGIINWCTVCGRICKGHNHYELGTANGSVPAIIFGKDPFAPSCEGEGGGGVTEKLHRFHSLRQHAKKLQEEVGKKDWWDAMDELCEKLWNAPTIPTDALATNKFNIPNTNFPLIIPEITNAPNIPYTGQLPLVHPKKTATIENAWMTDDFNLIQFRHPKTDGTMNNHDGPGQQISREAFVGWLKDLLADPTSFKLGKCWQFKTQAQQAILTPTEKSLMCDAILHPEEVNAALDLTDDEQHTLAERYRTAFNIAMDTRRSVRP